MVIYLLTYSHIYLLTVYIIMWDILHWIPNSPMYPLCCPAVAVNLYILWSMETRLFPLHALAQGCTTRGSRAGSCHRRSRIWPSGKVKNTRNFSRLREIL